MEALLESETNRPSTAETPAASSCGCHCPTCLFGGGHCKGCSSAFWVLFAGAFWVLSPS